MNAAAHTPGPARQGSALRQIDRFGGTCGGKGKAESALSAASHLRVIKNDRPVVPRPTPRPVPGNEIRLKRPRPEIDVVIPLAFPATVRQEIAVDLLSRLGNSRPPDMAAIRIQIERIRMQEVGLNANAAAEAPWQEPVTGPGKRRFLEFQLQSSFGPGQSAVANPEAFAGADETIRAALRHGPDTSRGIVERHVEGDMVLRRLSPGEMVVGREHRAYEGDDREGEIAAVAGRVDIPPLITAGRDRPVKAASAIT